MFVPLELYMVLVRRRDNDPDLPQSRWIGYTWTFAEERAVGKANYEREDTELTGISVVSWSVNYGILNITRVERSEGNNWVPFGNQYTVEEDIKPAIHAYLASILGAMICSAGKSFEFK